MTKIENRKKAANGNKLIVSLEVDKQILEYYGDTNIAILYSNLRFWCLHNEDKHADTHFNNGKWWMYNSRQAFSKQFPFWDAQKIYRMLNKLVKDGFVEKGSFNKATYDNTNWYCIINK